MDRTTRSLVRAHSLRLVREDRLSIVADEAPARSPREVARFLTPFAERELAETVWVVALSAQHRVIRNAPIVITRGLLTSSLVHPREVFRAAIVAGAAAIIIAHNHPSGDPTPSKDDRLVTEQLVAAGKMLDIPVHDHIIVGTGGRYTSFAEQGLM